MKYFWNTKYFGQGTPRPNLSQIGTLLIWILLVCRGIAEIKNATNEKRQQIKFKISFSKLFEFRIKWKHFWFVLYRHMYTVHTSHINIISTCILFTAHRTITLVFFSLHSFKSIYINITFLMWILNIKSLLCSLPIA